jgi:hypothetical protein
MHMQSGAMMQAQGKGAADGSRQCLVNKWGSMTMWLQQSVLLVGVGFAVVISERKVVGLWTGTGVGGEQRGAGLVTLGAISCGFIKIQNQSCKVTGCHGCSQWSEVVEHGRRA